MAEADTDFQFDVALVAATREPSDAAGSAVRQVSAFYLLYRYVTFRANLADNLTRSP